MTDGQIATLLARTAKVASEGRFERFKTTNGFDGTAQNPEWLGEMVSQLLQPGVGAVGARLWYPDGRLQHGGVIVGLGGVAGHAHYCWPHGHPGYFNRAILQQNFSAVTAACMLVSKSVFKALGRFDEENLGVSFNDIDFCLRMVEKGLRIVWTP